MHMSTPASYSGGMKAPYPFMTKIVQGLICSAIYFLIALVTFDHGRPKWALLSAAFFFAGWSLLGMLPHYLRWRKTT